jgi:DNA-binding response OmpR family regulator
MKKILLIEDDTDLCSLLKFNIEKEGFSLTSLQSGKGALDLCRQVRPDLILLDITLPDSDGLNICQSIRADPELASTPVIFLTARASEADRVVGLERGANDYVVKPFFVRELIARIKVQCRNQAPPSRLLESAGLELDVAGRQVWLHGRPLALTATEFRLLEYLMSHAGVACSRPELLKAVWGQDKAIIDRVVDVYILRLRQKVELDPAAPAFIHSVRGSGYTFGPRRAVAMACKMSS